MRGLEIKYIGITLLGVSFLTSCLKSDFDPISRTEGEADFTHYIAVGNSLTMGYQDGGLHNEKAQQSNSYPAIIAHQMALCNPNMDEFLQPLVSGNGSGFRSLATDSQGELTVIAPGDPGGMEADPSFDNWGDSWRKYNNLGIAGLAIWQTSGTDLYERIVNHAIFGGLNLMGGEPLNPYAKFLDFGGDPTSIFGSQPTYSYLDHVKRSEATFFTSWLGNNDVLGWTLNGGDPGEMEILGIGILEANPLTEVAEFRAKYDSILLAFHNMGAKGVIATLPDVTSIPMVTTVNEAYLEVEELWITEGATGNVRLKTDEDMVLLYGLESIQQNDKGLTQSNPIEHTYVMDRDEMQIVQTRTAELNNVIWELAAKYDFGVVDMHLYLDEFGSGFYLDGVELSAKFVEGGVFSLDGVHPNTKGYAIIANFFIEEINNKYGSNIPPVNVNEYKGIVFPND